MTTTDRFAAAIAAWRAALGADRVLVDPTRLASYGANVTEYAPRRIPAVLLARCRRDVIAVLEVANVHRVPVYPQSRGRNWGVGSKLPVVDGCAVLDLGGMDRILEVNEAFAYALVEPGVTQRALHRHLAERRLPLALNVTGAGEETSVVGNLLERGVGMRGPRAADLRALEAVTGSGHVVRTGLWHFFADESPERCVFHYPAGLGPDLAGLFLQSNLGVVTAAVVGLAPREPAALALLATRESCLGAFVDALAGLRQRGLLGDRIEIDGEDDPRLEGVARPADGGERLWWTWAPLSSDPELGLLQRRRLAEAAGPLCEEVAFFDGAPGAAGDLPMPVRARLARLGGEPGNHSLEAMARASGVAVTSALDADLERAIPGFVCALPAVPFQGGAVLRTLGLLDAVAAELGVSALASFNSVGPHAVEGYLRVVFDRRRADQVARAHRWNEVVHERLAGAGLYPMRLNVEQMAAFTARPDDGYWTVIARLKQALDPNEILAPGRYCPRS